MQQSYSPIHFPKSVFTAGIIWIVSGSLGIISFILNMVFAAQAGGSSGGNIVQLIISVAFVVVGVQSVKGTAKDTLGNSIGSIVLGGIAVILGLLMLAGAAVVAAQLPSGMAALLTFLSGLVLFNGGALVLAGILALVGRSAYLAWRHANVPGPMPMSRPM